MIIALIAASLSHSAALPPRKMNSPAPCQAAPTMCLAQEEGIARPLEERADPVNDNKIAAYRFEARPCRIIGNLGCQKQARFQLFRLGEPLRETLLRTFAPR